jgi:very-short-patch-repair endonuclease
MLRSYIEFAQQGIKALESELTFNNNLEFDSPFEIAVYDFLQSKGYNVVTQVGCSGFRIDMAVKHPTQSGKFAIGIECDGATYHSSRTARERDRLRQTVLEDMGWTIYRIWSTDWIKDSKSEGEKLVNAIDRTLGRIISDENNSIDILCDNEEEIVPIVEIEEVVSTTETINDGFNFEPYERANIFNLILDGNCLRDKKDILFDIISLEQPIHFDELCRRILPIYGRQKVTNVVIDAVRDLIYYDLRNKVEIDNNFVKVKSFTDLKVRSSNLDDDYRRDILYICDDELALAMKTIIQRSIGITKDSLFSAIRKIFGFASIGNNIRTSLEDIYEQLLKNNVIVEIDGKINIANK